MTHDSTSPTTPLKRCTKCGQEKPATTEYFARRKSNKDGLYIQCKECARAYRAANRDRILEYNRTYYRTNHEREIERARAYRKAHPDRVIASVHAWAAAHPENNAAGARRRRARKARAAGSHTVADVQAQYKRQKGRCYYCHEKLGDTYHVDHVVPLARGGSDGPENLVIACPTCNLRKKDKLPSEWPEGGRLL